MQTFVKLMLRLMMYVTTSPTVRRRRSSAASTIAFTFADPCASSSAVPSSTEMSSLASARSSTRATSVSMSQSSRSTAPPKLSNLDFRVSISDAIACLLSVCLDCLRFSLHQPLLVRHLVNALAQRTWNEPVPLHDVLWVDREPFSQLEAGRRRRFSQLDDLRPGLLGVDVVPCYRRDAAPVVDAGEEIHLVGVRRQVRRRLDVHPPAENQPRHRDRPYHVEQRRLRGVRHRDAGLGSEVLDDHFLDVAVALVQFLDREPRIDALLQRLTDADEDTSGEGDLQPARYLDGREPLVRHLVRAAVVRFAFAQEPRADRLDHDSSARAHLSQGGDVTLRQDPGVDVRE